jgi:hypothetical protein
MAAMPAIAAQARNGPGWNFEGLARQSGTAFDNPAFLKAWLRYLDGEKGTFTQAMYSPSGRLSHEDIKARLKVDPEFATGIHAFCEDFARYVRAQPPHLRFPIVTSDRGKLYTLLGHASGRFD